MRRLPYRSALLPTRAWQLGAFVGGMTALGIARRAYRCRHPGSFPTGPKSRSTARGHAATGRGRPDGLGALPLEPAGGGVARLEHVLVQELAGAARVGLHERLDDAVVVGDAAGDDVRVVGERAPRDRAGHAVLEGLDGVAQRRAGRRGQDHVVEELVRLRPLLAEDGEAVLVIAGERTVALVPGAEQRLGDVEVALVVAGEPPGRPLGGQALELRPHQVHVAALLGAEPAHDGAAVAELVDE